MPNAPFQSIRNRIKKIPWRRVISRFKRFGLPIGTIGLLVFAIYLGFLYQQLERSFQQQEEFRPTKIYSDVTKIAPPQTRKFIRKRLKELDYEFTETADQIQFKLRPIDYPNYLIPNDHPTFEAQGKTVQLLFDGSDRQSLLVEILASEPIPELYLEPEIVNRLFRTNAEGEKPVQIRAITRFEDFPARVWQAIIAVEDQHYLDHQGLDPRAFLRALWVDIKTLSFAQGGSTITQQLVKNLMARRTKNLFKKVNEIFLSFILEARYTKEEILERYLNEVYLGQIGSLQIHGVSEGAQYFFSKNLEELNLAEITLMAGLIRGPIYYSPYKHWERAIERQRVVLNQMVKTGNLSEEEARAAERLPIRLTPPPKSKNRSPYFTDYVKARLVDRLKDRMNESEIVNQGFRVYTTLNPTLNDLAQKAVQNGVKRLDPKKELGLEGALASVDHRNGYIRALVGGSDYRTTNFNRILNMKRQVGSTFKPVVYLTAFEQGLGPGSPFEDRRWTLVYDEGRQKWSPKNYKNDYRGWISLKEAFIHSINTVAARLGVLVGTDSMIGTAKRLGLSGEFPDVPSIALGAVEVTPIDLLRMYATIANRGQRDELTVIRAITQGDGKGFARFVYNPSQYYDPAMMDLMTELMQSVFAEGTAAPAIQWGFDRPAAGKTGTTNDHRDSWFAGFTPQLTTVVWVGIDEGANKDEKGKAKLRLTGAGSALPVWTEFMRKGLESEPPLPFPDSEELTTIRVDRYSGRQATPDCPDNQVINEKYIRGLEPADFGCAFDWPEGETTVVN